MECTGSCVGFAGGDKLLEVNQSQDASARQDDRSKLTGNNLPQGINQGRSHRPGTLLFISILLVLLASGRRLRCCASWAVIIAQKTPPLSYDNGVSTKSSIQRYAPGCVRHRQGQKDGEIIERCRALLLTLFLHPFDFKLTRSLKQLRI